MSSDDDLGKCSLKNKTSSGGNIFNIENSYGGIPQVSQMQGFYSGPPLLTTHHCSFFFFLGINHLALIARKSNERKAKALITLDRCCFANLFALFGLNGAVWLTSCTLACTRMGQLWRKYFVSPEC